MANQYFNFNTDPTKAELDRVARQQKLADVLSSQGDEPIKQFSYNGIPAPISPLSGLAKILNAYSGAKAARDTAEESKRVQAKSAEDEGKDFNDLVHAITNKGTPAVPATPLIMAPQGAGDATDGQPYDLQNTAISSGFQGGARPAVAATPGGIESIDPTTLRTNAGREYYLNRQQDLADAAAKREDALAADQIKILAQVPSGYQRNPSGELEPIPGGPADPSRQPFGGGENGLARAFLINPKSDPNSPQYLAAYNLVATPTFGYDPTTHAQTTVYPNMDAYRPPGGGALGGGAPGGGAPSGRTTGAAPPIPPTTAEQNAAFNIRTERQVMTDALAVVVKNPQAFGFGPGTKGTVGFGLGAKALGPEAVLARSIIGNLRSSIQNARSGANVTASEMPLLDKFLPSDFDDAPTIMAKLNGYLGFLKSKEAALPASAAAAAAAPTPTGPPLNADPATVLKFYLGVPD